MLNRRCSIEADKIERLAEKFGSVSKLKSKIKDPQKILLGLLRKSIESYEKERHCYQEILDLSALDEYRYDVNSFKSKVLRDEIPIIRRTLKNKQAKELDKFRAAFNTAKAGELFEVTSNIVKLANERRYQWYKEEEFEEIDTWDDLGYGDFDYEGYIAYGVIGGGIKSHFMYKLFPEMYPNRSREAIWALYYLSNRKKFGCKQDSQFLMIDVEQGTTQQNYFYHYGLFAFYALQIFKELKGLYSEYGVIIPTEYRFVAVDSFLSFVAGNHQSEINSLKQKSKDKCYGYEH